MVILYDRRPDLDPSMMEMVRAKALRVLAGEDRWGERHSRLYAATVRDLLIALGLSPLHAEALGNELAGRVWEHLRVFRAAHAAAVGVALQ